VWIVAEVFGRDLQAFRPGATVRVTLPGSEETLRATVSNVLPEVDPATRAMRIRLEADNPGFKLRPNMFVSVEMPISLPAGLSVPADAIVDSGLSRRVYVESSEGHFEPRVVETGWRLGDRVQILSGLREGETVVSSGTFLVDSESKLKQREQQAAPMKTAALPATAMAQRMN
jgi:multidrug efflux pump subunit AcrA (membrane-fusion protein)